MYWQDKDPLQQVVPDTIVDVAFALDCRCIPLEHTHALSEALMQALPWLRDESEAGIHMIHGAESGNGWYRPEAGSGDELLYLSRRTRLELRLPKVRVGDAGDLTGRTLDVGGYPLRVGKLAVRPLSTLGTLFSRYVVGRPDEDEERFLAAVVEQLAVLDVRPRKMLCGRSHAIGLPEGRLFTRSLMVAELDREQSLRLQQRGLGPGRKLGCGLFLPHKDIAPVRPGADE